MKIGDHVVIDGQLLEIAPDNSCINCKLFNTTCHVDNEWGWKCFEAIKNRNRKIIFINPNAKSPIRSIDAENTPNNTGDRL